MVVFVALHQVIRCFLRWVYGGARWPSVTTRMHLGLTMCLMCSRCAVNNGFGHAELGSERTRAGLFDDQAAAQHAHTAGEIELARLLGQQLHQRGFKRG